MNMPDLHRVGRLPEWETVPPEDWNEHQQRAAETNGWDTPGNRESLKGVIATSVALVLMDHDTGPSSLAGTILMGYGRVKDLKDGKVADATGTKSPLGEAIDAGADAALTLAAAKVLGRKDIIPVTERRFTIGIEVSKGAATGAAKTLNREIHTSRAGKLGMLLRWAGVGTHSVARVAHNFGAEDLGRKTSKVASGLNYAGMLLSTAATAGYIKAAITPSK